MGFVFKSVDPTAFKEVFQDPGNQLELDGYKVKSMTMSFDNVRKLRVEYTTEVYAYVLKEIFKHTTKCPKDHQLRDREIKDYEFSRGYICNICKTKLALGTTQKACWRRRCDCDICDPCRTGLIRQEQSAGDFVKMLSDSCKSNGAPDRLFLKYLGKGGLVQTAKGSAVSGHEDTPANAMRYFETRMCDMPHITDIGAIAFYDNPDGSTKEVLVGSDLSEYPDAPVV